HRGFEVDGDGNLWLAEAGTLPARGTEGMLVYKFSPQGQLLMTLGRRVIDGPDTFKQPEAVLVAPNGDIFVADDSRIVIFDKTGRFINAWEAVDTDNALHWNSLAMDSAGR